MQESDLIKHFARTTFRPLLLRLLHKIVNQTKIIMGKYYNL